MALPLRYGGNLQRLRQLERSVSQAEVDVARLWRQMDAANNQLGYIDTGYGPLVEPTSEGSESSEPGVATPCCPDGIPATLTATIAASLAPALVGTTFEMNYLEGPPYDRWCGELDLPSACGRTFIIALNCNENISVWMHSAGLLSAFVDCDDPSTAYAVVSSAVCDPVSIEFSRALTVSGWSSACRTALGNPPLVGFGSLNLTSTFLLTE
ncbi:hypothetical protein Pan216_08350 [Planctomycetes bacterium Pan216]|uniref:Uncharacterized protein n=1 Tax=Kolteria novifilia TaxID=2527975 RepID=A0A518AZ43_9BACT|nr:hypothetical protein Pan216_08350 [Planctomycetes bacterium Pan216]